MYCIGCGEPLRVTSGSCSACRTDVIGVQLQERVRLEYGTRVIVPPVCCCCLAPRPDDRVEEIASIALNGHKRYTKVPIPWCSGCQNRRRSYGRLATLGWVVVGVALYFLFAPWVDIVAWVIAFFGGFIGYIAAPPLLFGRFPNMRLPGHVPRCDAVHGSAGRRNAELILGNRAFARIWRDVNAGVASKAPALAWVEKTKVAPEDIVVRAQPRNSVVETGARVREHLDTARVPPRSRLKLQTRPVGVDAASEILRFVVKTLEIEPDRLRAIDRTGATRELAFSDVAGVIARRTPDGPPFSGAIFLDIVPAGSEPLRLLPTTRANYGSLPGTGATSHENFRRLARHLKTLSPNIVVEDDSSPYLEDGKGFPPLLETTEALVEFDRRYS